MQLLCLRAASCVDPSALEANLVVRGDNTPTVTGHIGIAQLELYLGLAFELYLHFVYDYPVDI